MTIPTRQSTSYEKLLTLFSCRESVRHQHEIITHTSGGQFTTDHKWTASIANVTDNTVVDISNGYVTAGTSIFGGDEYHNNVSPVMAVYLWKRTA